MTDVGSSPHATADQRVLNPLWLISLFLGLSELTVGVAATQVAGWIQALLAIFSVVFPVLVSGAFFYTLWQRPGILYAPRDYGDGTTVRDYVTELSAYTRRSIDIVENTIRSAAADADSEMGRLNIDEAKLRGVVEAMIGAVRESILTIDVSEFDYQRGEFSMAVNESTTVGQLLDAIWFAISNYVSVYSYRVEWILVDRETGEQLTAIGTRYAERVLRRRRDVRYLGEVGIRPTSKLSAVPLGGSISLE